MVPLFLVVYKMGMYDTYWGLIIPRVAAVSYTHLDVYKRQGYIDGTFNTHFLKLSTAEKTKNLELAKAVLQAEDVYKRQVYHCLLCIHFSRNTLTKVLWLDR